MFLIPKTQSDVLLVFFGSFLYFPWDFQSTDEDRGAAGRGDEAPRRHHGPRGDLRGTAAAGVRCPVGPGWGGWENAEENGKTLRKTGWKCLERGQRR